MVRRPALVATLLIGLVLPTSSALAQVDNLRITEVDPDGDTVEVTNTGAGFTASAAFPFCHRFNYISNVANGTNFAAGEIKLFTAASLQNLDSDLWLYKATPFITAANIVHGVKYGALPNVGRAALASTVGLWPSGTAFAPGPPPTTTLAYDGFGNDPKDWYVDETPSLGSADATTPGTVAKALVYPSGKQDFEGMSLGDEIIAITEWVITNSSLTSGIFTVRSVNDVLGVVGPRGASTRWLRMRDQDAADVQNRFYSPTIVSAGDFDYKWTYWVNLEQMPPGGAAVKTRIVVQHLDGGFSNAWGIEFTATGANLVVVGIGGTPASAPLYAISSPTGVGDWVKLEIAVDFTANTVSASVNDVPTASLAISLTGSKDTFRWCYRGEGTGNVMTMLVDDVCVDVIDPAVAARDVVARVATLEQNYPNPFNPSTTIACELVEVTDSRGHFGRGDTWSPRAG